MGTSSSSTKTLRASSPALTKLGSSGHGTCFWIFFVLIWTLATMKSSRSTRAKPTTRETSSKDARFVDSMSQERLWSRMCHLSQKQHWICKPLRWVNAASCIRQRRGSLMGSPLSPALCLMVIWIPGLQRKPSLHEFCNSLSNRCWLSCPSVCHLAWHGSVRFCPGQFLGFSTERGREAPRQTPQQRYPCRDEI